MNTGRSFVLAVVVVALKAAVAAALEAAMAAIVAPWRLWYVGGPLESLAVLW